MRRFELMAARGPFVLKIVAGSHGNASAMDVALIDDDGKEKETVGGLGCFYTLLHVGCDAKRRSKIPSLRRRGGAKRRGGRSQCNSTV